MLLQSNLITTTLIYTTPLILRHIFARPNFLVQNSLFYMTTILYNTTFRACICHIKEGINAKIPFIHIMYI
jgi:hypothetical protein